MIFEKSVSLRQDSQLQELAIFGIPPCANMVYGLTLVKFTD